MVALALACGPARPGPGASTIPDEGAPPAPAERHDPSRGSDELPEEPAQRDIFVDALAARAVYHDDFARARFYTWTSAEQAAALRRSGQLLIAEAATGGRPSPFNRSIDALARGEGPAAELARLLRDRPDLRRRRYAWTSAYATVLGLGPRRYGDEVIAIELDPRAWIGRFEPAAAEPLRFVDLAGAPVELAAVLAEPERLAGLYHVRDGPEEPIAYREYVLFGGAVIAGWSLATPEIAAALADEVALLRGLRAGALGSLPLAAIDAPAAPRWARRPEQADPLERWHASLAFDNRRYRPSVANLDRIIAALGEAQTRGPPLRWPEDFEGAAGGSR